MSYDVEEKGYIALVSPPTQTNAGSDTILTFASEVAWIYIQNNTSANANFMVDSAATLGTFLAIPGALVTIHKDAIQTIHLLTAAAQNINGVSGNNIVVLGSL